MEDALSAGSAPRRGRARREASGRLLTHPLPLSPCHPKGTSVMIRQGHLLDPTPGPICPAGDGSGGPSGLVLPCCAADRHSHSEPSGLFTSDVASPSAGSVAWWPCRDLSPLLRGRLQR